MVKNAKRTFKFNSTRALFFFAVESLAKIQLLIRSPGTQHENCFPPNKMNASMYYVRMYIYVLIILSYA